MIDPNIRGNGHMTRRIFLSASGAALAGLPFLSPAMALEEAPEKIRFGIVTDLHYANREPSGTRYYRDSEAKLQECVEWMNELDVAFLIELGDFKDQDPEPTEAGSLAHLRHIEEIFSQFDGPRYHVLGNHDMDSLSKAQFLSCIQNSGQTSAKAYYSFDIAGLHGVVLDGNYRSDGVDYDHNNYDWTDSNIPQAQLDWLKQDLASTKLPCVVFVHQRLDGEGDLSVKNAAEVRKVLEEGHKVLAVFQGHHHEGGYNLINNIHYYTQKAMVEGPGLDNNAYVLVELDAKGNGHITGYGKALSKDLAPAP